MFSNQLALISIILINLVLLVGIKEIPHVWVKAKF